MTYASGTKVTAEASRAEVERTLVRYGADSFAYGWQADEAVVAFRVEGRHVRFTLPMPDRDDPAITHRKANQHGQAMRERPAAEQEAMYQQAVRERWRALALVIKAKLEAVETGIVSFEQEFLAHVQLPDGSTVGEWVGPQVAQVYATGTMPELLPAARAALPATAT